MQKFGTVLLKNQADAHRYTFVQITVDPDYERIDIIEDLENYDIISTSNCNASYIRQTKEHYLGEQHLIEAFLNCRRSASTFQAPVSETVTVENGNIVITNEKVNEAIGYRMYFRMVNGVREEEIYETDLCQITVIEAYPDRGMDVAPINFNQYITNSLLGKDFDNLDNDVEYHSLAYLRQMYPIEHLDTYDFVVCGDQQEGDDRLKEWIEAPHKVKSIDFETTGVGMNVYHEDQITGVVLSYKWGWSTYFPFRQDECEFNHDVSFLRTIIEAVNNQPEDVVIVAHNAKFEIVCGMTEKMHVRVDADPFIGSTLITPVMQRGLHTLKSIVGRITGLFFLDLHMIFKGAVRFNKLPKDIIKAYACPDGPGAILAYEWVMENLPKDEQALYAVENELVYVKATNEFYGMRTNRKRLLEQIENETFKVNRLGEYFRKIHGLADSVNIRSNDVKADIFYNRLRCPVDVVTKTGKPSTSVIAVERIVDLGKIDIKEGQKIPPPIPDINNKPIIKGEELASNRYPSLVVLSKFNKATKELGALNRINRKSKGNRVFFNINQTGAGSGRQTSDAHQYSDTMKELILSDGDDWYLWSCDQKQVELRILMYLAGQTDLIELAKDPENDIHRAILSIINGLEMWEISDEMRKRGKTVNFGVVYMMSEYGLSRRNYGPKYTREQLKESLESITSFYNGLPKIKAFVKSNEDYVKKHGYIKTAFKRYRYFKQILDETTPADKVNKMVRAANNTPVQGFAADMMKMIENNIFRYIKKMGWDELVQDGEIELPKVRLMLSIHDEVLLSSHKSIPIEEIIKMFKECMEIEIEGAPPFYASPAMVGNWYDGKLDQYEIPIKLRDKIIEAWDRDRTSIIHVDTYLEDLNAFRKGELLEYMEEMVAKYKTPEAVAAHLRHPSFTHTLISAYVPKGKLKQLTHMERIEEAVRCYFADRDNLVDTTNSEKIEDAQEKFEIEGLLGFEELQEYMSFDANGEVIIEDLGLGDEEDDDTDSIYRDYPADWDVIQKSYVIYSMDQCIIDFVGLDVDGTAELAHQGLYQLSNPKEHYEVVYMIKHGVMVRPGFRVGYKPDEINNMIRTYVSKEAVSV